MQLNKNQNFISLKQAAEILDYSPDYIGWLIREGKISGRKIFSKEAWKVSRRAILNYASKNNKKFSHQKNWTDLLRSRTYIPLRQAAKISGYDPDYVGWLIREGKIPGKKFYLKTSWELSESTVRKYKKRRDKRRRERSDNYKLFFVKQAVKNIHGFGWRFGLAAMVLFFVIFGVGPINFLHNSIQAFTEKTKTVKFYATDFQGSWQNNQKAIGPPEVNPKGTINSFSGANSAVYSHGALTLVCKGFQEEASVNLRRGP